MKGFPDVIYSDYWKKDKTVVACKGSTTKSTVN